MSQSARTAWIEILIVRCNKRRVLSRSPQGLRGLKLQGTCLCSRRSSRSPQGLRGLKLRFSPTKRESRWSQSARTAWIEIIEHSSLADLAVCRSPQGLRGLKSLHTVGAAFAQWVAVRKDCVD